MKATPPYTSFNGGEVSAELEGRIDIEKYHSSLYRSINGIPMIQGPWRRRSGTRFVKEAKDSTKPPFISKFIFNVNQSFILEWGDRYVRFYTNHGAVLEALQTITGATQASPAVITVAGHGLSNGDEVFISGIVGMTRLNNRYFKVAGVTTDTFQLQDFGGNNIDSTGYAAYVSGGTVGRVYTVATPYAYADLTDSNGLFTLRFAQIADVIYITNTLSTYPVQKLSRFADNNWVLTQVVFAGGPFKPVNPLNSPVMAAVDQTGSTTVFVYIAAIIQSMGTDGGGRFAMLTQPLWQIPPDGTVVVDLTSDNANAKVHAVHSGSTTTKLYIDDPTPNWKANDTIVIQMGPQVPVFQQGHVGALLYLGTHDIHRVKPWEVGKKYIVETGGNHPHLSRFNGVTYRCFDAGTAGTVPPTHLFGDAYDGTPEPDATPPYQPAGWTYADPGYGWAVITAVAMDGNSVTVLVGDPTNVDPPIQYPIGVTAAENLSWKNDGVSGGPYPTPLWALGAWNEVDGYPTHVYFFLNRLCFARNQNMWFSVSEDFENFVAATPGGVVTDDMSISIVAPVSDVITWLQEATSISALGVGTSGGELVAGQISNSQPLSPTNTQISPQGTRGSRAMPAIRIANGIIFVQTSGRKLRKLVYEFYTNSWQSTDLTILARDLPIPGIVEMDYQQEPDSVIWMVRADGLLLGLTYDPPEVEDGQDVTAWHRHPFTGKAGSSAKDIGLFVSDQDNEVLFAYDSSSLAQTAEITGFDDASLLLGMIFGAGLVWVADAGLQQILAFKPTDNGAASPTIRIVGGATTMTGPSDIAIGASGKLYVADVNVGILIFAANTNGNVAPIATIGGAGNPISPISVAVDAAENVYVINQAQQDRVLVYRKGTTGDVPPDVTITDGSSALAQAYNVRIDASGNVWVVNKPNFVEKFPPIGAASGTINPNPLVTLNNAVFTNDPVGIAFDAENNIYVAMLNVLATPPGNGQVFKFASTATGGDAPIAMTDQLPSSGQCGGVAFATTPATSGGGPAVKSIATIPAPAGDRDELWLVIQRTINGRGVAYVEYMEKAFEEGDAQASACCMDCSVQYSGPPVTTIFPLDHLEGETVRLLVDGAAHPDCVVTNGEVTLQAPHSVVQVGEKMPYDFITLRVEAGSQLGTAQAKLKRITKLNGIRLLNSLGGKIGAFGQPLDELEYRDTTDPMDSPPALFTGDKVNLSLNADWERDGRIEVADDGPFPFCIVALFPELSTTDG